MKSRIPPEATAEKIKRLAKTVSLFICLSFSLGLTGCASYQGKVSDARNLMQAGDYTAAADKLKPLAEKEDGDQLVYLLDYGVALGLGGKLKDSNSILLKADKVAEKADYHSITRNAGSLITSEGMIQYKGDTFEKIFINAYLAMNYLELNELDDALVESRRMNEKYLLLRSDDKDKKKTEQNVFGKYLSAMVWEASHQYDDAYIAYSEAYALDPYIPALKKDLIRAAKLSRRMDDYQDWKKKFSKVTEDPRWYDRSNGELIVIFQQGWGPRKVPRSENSAIPTLQPTTSFTKEARMTVDGSTQVSSESVYNVESAAIKTLNDDYNRLIAKQLAGIAAKEVLADQIRQQNELLGFVAKVAMYASNRADLRQWSTLPQSIQTIRIPLKAGTHKISIQGLGYSDQVTEDRLPERDVLIKAGQKTFLIWRSLH